MPTTRIDKVDWPTLEMLEGLVQRLRHQSHEPFVARIVESYILLVRMPGRERTRVCRIIREKSR